VPLLNTDIILLAHYSFTLASLNQAIEVNFDPQLFLISKHYNRKHAFHLLNFGKPLESLKNILTLRRNRAS
jgi:hypothetical protein